MGRHAPFRPGWGRDRKKRGIIESSGHLQKKGGRGQNFQAATESWSVGGATTGKNNHAGKSALKHQQKEKLRNKKHNFETVNKYKKTDRKNILKREGKGGQQSRGELVQKTGKDFNITNQQIGSQNEEKKKE